MKKKNKKKKNKTEETFLHHLQVVLVHGEKEQTFPFTQVGSFRYQSKVSASEEK